MTLSIRQRLEEFFKMAKRNTRNTRCRGTEQHQPPGGHGPMPRSTKHAARQQLAKEEQKRAAKKGKPVVPPVITTLQRAKRNLRPHEARELSAAKQRARKLGAQLIVLKASNAKRKPTKAGGHTARHNSRTQRVSRM